MASNQGQDYGPCHVCSKGITHFCITCNNLGLCMTCVKKHKNGEGSSHEIGKVLKRKKKDFLDSPFNHQKISRTDGDCNDKTSPPINFDEEFTQKQQEKNTGNDVEALKKCIFAALNKFQKYVEPGLSSAEYDAELASIKSTEQDICRNTRDLSNKIREMVTKERRKSVGMNKNASLSPLPEEKSLDGTVGNEVFRFTGSSTST